MASDEECSAIGEYRDDNRYHSLSSYRTGRIATVLRNHLILFEVRSFDDLQVVSAILGQGLILGNIQLLEYGGVVWVLFHLFVLVYEEPSLRAATFGSEYTTFCAEVPRWIPRFTP